MNNSILQYLALGLLVITSLVLILSTQWRWTAIALGIQYGMVFLLVAPALPIGLAAVKLLTGLMVVTILSASQPTFEPEGQAYHGSSVVWFRLLAAGLIWLFVFTMSPALSDWVPASYPVLTGGVLLFGMGILQLGMTTRTLRVILGLLTALSGFEIIYASIEPSSLVAALLSATTLGLALVGGYLMMEADEVEQ